MKVEVMHKDMSDVKVIEANKIFTDSNDFDENLERRYLFINSNEKTDDGCGICYNYPLDELKYLRVTEDE